MSLKPPPRGRDHPDPLIDCEMELEPMFQALICAAVNCGWPERIAALALGSLARNHLLAMAANAQTERAIAAARAENRQ